MLIMNDSPQPVEVKKFIFDRLILFQDEGD